jgi:hypothetical protein
MRASLFEAVFGLGVAFFSLLEVSIETEGLTAFPIDFA